MVVLRRFHLRPDGMLPLSGHHSQMPVRQDMNMKAPTQPTIVRPQPGHHQAAVEDVHHLDEAAVAARPVDQRRRRADRATVRCGSGGSAAFSRLWSRWRRPASPSLLKRSSDSASPGCRFARADVHKRTPASSAGPSMAWRCGSSLASSQSCQTRADPVRQIGMIRIARRQPDPLVHLQPQRPQLLLPGLRQARLPRIVTAAEIRGCILIANDYQ